MAAIVNSGVSTPLLLIPLVTTQPRKFFDLHKDAVGNSVMHNGFHVVKTLASRRQTNEDCLFITVCFDGSCLQLLT